MIAKVCDRERLKQARLVVREPPCLFRPATHIETQTSKSEPNLRLGLANVNCVMSVMTLEGIKQTVWLDHLQSRELLPGPLLGSFFFWGGRQGGARPQRVDLLKTKSELFECNPQQKCNFWSILWLKVCHLADSHSIFLFLILFLCLFLFLFCFVCFFSGILCFQ